MFDGRESGEKTFTFPTGFTKAEEFEPAYANIEGYRAKGITVPEKGTYAQNNGVIAAVDSKGDIALWIPKSDPATPREVPYEKAIQSLEDAGYRDVGGSFYVPQSN